MSNLSSLEGLNQQYFSPYLIFIKGAAVLDDRELLRRLGLKNYGLPIKPQEAGMRYLFLTEDAQWTYLMDDWSYTLWHDKTIRSNLLKLSAEFEIFSCSVGDIDDSFDFTHYQNGSIIRAYAVEESASGQLIIAKNLGEPFPCEAEALKQKEIYEKCTMIAKSLGISFDLQKEKTRIYCKQVIPKRLE